MNGTILVIGSVGSDVKSKDYELFRYDLSQCGIKPRIIRAHIDATEVTIGDHVFAFDPDPDPDGKLSHAQLNNVLRVEQYELKQHFATVLGALTPIAMVVMKEATWLTWGSQLSGVAHIFEQALQYLYPFAQRLVVHPAGSPLQLETV